MIIEAGKQIHRRGFQGLATATEQQPFVPALTSHLTTSLYLGKSIEMLEPGQGLWIQRGIAQPHYDALLAQRKTLERELAGGVQGGCEGGQRGEICQLLE